MIQYDLGRYLVMLRENAGLSQEKLGEKLGVGGKSVSKWERGICIPSIKNIIRMSEIFNVSCDEILKKINF